MFSLKSLFGGRRKSILGDNGDAKSASPIDFVHNNVNDVRAFVSALGGNSLAQRLDDIASHLSCSCLLLCNKLSASNKYIVIETSNVNVAEKSTVFEWLHAQPFSSDEARAILETLPFKRVGASGVISVPIKNDRKVVIGLMLGIYTVKLTEDKLKLQYLDIISPVFEPEVRYARLRSDRRQMEERLNSVRQDLETKELDLKREKERSSENRELKSVFLTNLSHEIRTPMNAIMGFIDLLCYTDDEAERKKFLGIIKENGSLLLTVIDNLIEVSKLQSSYMMKAALPNSLNDLLTKMKTKFEAIIARQGKDIVFETMFQQQAPEDTIWTSAEVITKVLDQVLDNACRFTVSGKISLAYSMTIKELIIYVSDTGPGIRRGMEEQVFDLFGKASDTDLEQEGSKGKGVGLAIAKKYVSLVNGSIYVDKDYRDGTRIVFTIPNTKL